MTQQERANRTEKILRELNIPINPSLPLMEDESEIQVRKASDIAKRILILTYLNIIADDEVAKLEIIEFLKNESLWDFLSGEEKSLLAKEKLTIKDKINISWRSEAIWTLLWAIKKVDILQLPTEECNVADILNLQPSFFEPTNEFIYTAHIRESSEILDMSDFIYRLHWAVRDSELKGQDIPNGMNAGVIYERHYAINWITCYEDDWDEITTDT
jgi:hypothetical protein